MKLLDLFHPYLDLLLADTLPAPHGARAQTVTGIAFDQQIGNLLVVDPRLEVAGNPCVLSLTLDGIAGELMSLPELAGCRLNGVAAVPGGGFWVSDQAFDGVHEFDSTWSLTRSLGPADLSDVRPGSLATNEHGALFVADRLESIVLHLDPSAPRVERFEAAPLAGGHLAGLTWNAETNLLWASFVPRIAERDGRVLPYGVFEMSTAGRVLRCLDTDSLGFCPLDMAHSAETGLLYALSRPFVLPQCLGDQTHVFVVDSKENPPAVGDVSAKIAARFLRQNNLVARTDSGWRRGRSRRWPRLPIRVHVEPLTDLSLDDVQGVLHDWKHQSRGRVHFELSPTRPEEGIVITESSSASTEGRPGPNTTVRVCVCDRQSLGAYPNGTDPRSAQLNVLRHEVGHALGFADHSPRFGIDTMNSIAGYSSQISAEEGAFMEALYSLPPEAPLEKLNECISWVCERQ